MIPSSSEFLWLRMKVTNKVLTYHICSKNRRSNLFHIVRKSYFDSTPFFGVFHFFDHSHDTVSFQVVWLMLLTLNISEPIFLVEYPKQSSKLEDVISMMKISDNYKKNLNILKITLSDYIKNFELLYFDLKRFLRTIFVSFTHNHKNSELLSIIKQKMSSTDCHLLEILDFLERKVTFRTTCVWVFFLTFVDFWISDRFKIQMHSDTSDSPWICIWWYSYLLPSIPKIHCRKHVFKWSLVSI